MRASLARTAHLAAVCVLFSTASSAQERIELRRTSVGELIEHYAARRPSSVRLTPLARQDAEAGVVWLSPDLESRLFADEAIFDDLLATQGLSVDRTQVSSAELLRVTSNWREDRERRNQLGPWVELDELLTRRGSASRIVRCKLQLEAASAEALAGNLLDTAWGLNRPWTLGAEQCGTLILGGRAGQLADLALMALAADAHCTGSELEESLIMQGDQLGDGASNESVRFAPLAELGKRSGHLDWVNAFGGRDGHGFAIQDEAIESLNNCRGGLLRPLLVSGARAPDVLAAMLEFEGHELRMLTQADRGLWWLSTSGTPKPSLSRPPRAVSAAQAAHHRDDSLHDIAVPLRIGENSNFHATVIDHSDTHGFKSLRYLPVGLEGGDFVLRGRPREVLDALELRATILESGRFGPAYVPPVRVDERALDAAAPSNFAGVLRSLGEQTGTHFLISTNALDLMSFEEFSIERDWGPDLGTTWMKVERALSDAGYALVELRRDEPRIFGIRKVVEDLGTDTNFRTVYIPADELEGVAEQPALWARTVLPGEVAWGRGLHLKLTALGVYSEGTLAGEAILMTGRVANLIEACRAVREYNARELAGRRGR